MSFSMNLFSPELAPLMLASPEGAPVIVAGVLIRACVLGIAARGISPNMKLYSVVCSGVAIWVVSRDFAIPLDALLCATAPQFALVNTPDGHAPAIVGLAGLAQYVAYSSPAPPPPNTTHVAWTGILAFLYVRSAASVASGIARAFIVGLWYVYPRIAHVSSGAMLAGCAMSGAPAVLAALGSTLSMSILGSYAPLVISIAGLVCCFTI